MRCHSKLSNNKKGGGPGRPASQEPAGLTEGDRLVVCWPTRETPAPDKKFRAAGKNLSRIVADAWVDRLPGILYRAHAPHLKPQP